MLWFVAAVAIWIRELTAPTAPDSVAASLVFHRSEMKAAPSPSSSARTTS